MIDVRRILCVEDNPEDQAVYRRYLSRSFGESIDLVIKETGQSALEYLLENQNEIDSILLDYQLPDMSGVDFLNKLPIEIKTFIPIIVMTGEGSEKVAVRALKSGADDYLIKSDIKSSEVLYKAITNAIEKLALRKQIKDQEGKIKFMAYHDYLTSIPNRYQFERLAQQALSRAKRHQRLIAILIIDIDRFKNVNDSLGHEIGDLLLTQTAKRFKSVLQEGDVLARLGGDEFALIIEDMKKPDDASVVARKLIQKLQSTFVLNNNRVNVTASIGIANYPDAGETVSELMRNADAALYRAKEEGKNTFRNFTKKLNVQAKWRFRVENLLKEAIGKKELYLHYQPIFNLADKELYGIEALLCWDSPELGEVPPSKVIPIAQDTGLIIPLGQWVIEEALKQYQIWRKSTDQPFKLAINLSPKQLYHQDWLDDIKALISKYEIDPSVLIFELTETDVLVNLEAVNKSFGLLVGMGCQIFIDDFGVGYSSLNLIRKLPISGLKIDKSFIKNVHTNPNDASLVESVLILAENMKLTVVAEGIENEFQYNFMKSYPKTKGQGFYLAKPSSPSKIKKFFK